MLIFWMLVHPVFSLTYLAEEKRWGFVALFSVIYLMLGTGLSVLLLYLLSFLAGVISNVYVANQKAIEGIVFITLCFVALIYYIKQRRQPKEPPKPQPDVDAESKAAERTYVNVASVIIFILQKAAKVFPLVSPISASDIYSPARARKEGEIWYYRYAIVKTETVDVNTVKRFLNDELTRTLFNHEAHGIARNTVFIDGAEYPALMVTEVKDTGSYLTISVVVTSAKVKRLLDFRHSTTLDANGKKENTDDDQFIQ